MAVFQSADLLASGGSCIARSQYVPLFKTIKLSTSSMAGIAHISKAAIPFIFKRREVTIDNIEEVVGIIFFRMGDLTGVACIEPQFEACCHQACETAHSICNITLLLTTYTKRAKLRRSALVIAYWANGLFNQVNGLFNRVTGRGATLPIGTHAGRGAVLPNGAQEEHIAILYPAPEVHTEQQIEEYYDNLVDQVTTHWSTLDEIPEDIAIHPNLRQFICPITQKVIRFAFSPKSNMTICYEKEAIQQQLSSGLVPPLL